MSFIVAIDGPAGTGKGTITEIISKQLNLVNIGTGSAYRCVALAAIENNINIDDTEKIVDLLDKIKIEFKKINDKDLIFLNGKDVTKRLREKDVSTTVSKVSLIKDVRFKLTDIFKKQAETRDVIMEGRDIGTCVFPNADVKIFLDASLDERIRRRVKQNEELGIDMSLQEIEENMRQRDYDDKTREFGALKQADDAIYIDSSDLSIDEVVNKVIDIINVKKEKIKRE